MKIKKILFLVLVSSAVSVYAQTNPVAQPGNVGQVKSPEATVGSKTEAEETSAEINVKNADLAAVIRIFSKKTKRNFILDERVKGKVSIYLPGKLSEDDSLKILDSVLGLKGFTSVPIGDNLWKIVPSKEAGKSTVPTLKDDIPDVPSAAVVTRILPLKYVAAEEVQQVASQLVSADGMVNAFGGTNSLLVIDYEDNIDRVAKIIENLDVPFANRELTIIPIKNADAEDIAKKLTDILGSPSSDKSKATGGGVATDIVANNAQANGQVGGAVQGGIQNINQTGRAAAGSPNGSASSQRSREPKFIADERTNSIIVVADDDTTARIRALVHQLDSDTDLSGHRFYVYRCQHADAGELADTLGGLSGSGGGSSKSKTSSSSSLGDSEDSKSTGGGLSRSKNSKDSGSSVFGAGRKSKKKNSEGGATSVQFGEDVSITADKATNSLIILAGRADFEKLKKLLSQLDVKRRQVQVEAAILEVSISKSDEFAVDLQGSDGGKDGGVVASSNFGRSSDSIINLIRNPAEMTRFTVAAASSGSLVLPGGIKIPSQSLLLTAAQDNNDVNILSAPNILTTDNEEAEIVVGQNVPFLASTSTNDTNLSNTFNQIDREDVGITLRITPQISSQSFVTLNVYTEVSSLDATSAAASNLGPTTNKRKSETTVIAKDGQMIVIGGLISDGTTKSDSGVPFLRDIPILGMAFGASAEAHKKQNLLIFITPHIVKDQFDARDITKDDSSKMQDEIQAREIYPDRGDVLNNTAIDNVVEGKLNTDIQMNGIVPPKSDTDSDFLVKSEEPTVSHSAKIDAPSALSFKIKPNLPSVRKEIKVEDSKAKNSVNNFVILKRTSQNSSDAIQEDDNKEAILKFPDGVDPELTKFFKTGSSYKYDGSIYIVKETLKDLKDTDSSLTIKTIPTSEVLGIASGSGKWQKLGDK